MKIDLSRTCETWIRIRDVRYDHVRNKEGALFRCSEAYLGFLHSEIIPLIRKLKDGKVIKWFCFLVHALPGTDDVPCVHIRMELADGVHIDELKRNLPGSCELTRAVCRAEMLVTPDGVNKEILKDSNSGEAWWIIIGESSVWIMNMLEAHSKEADIPVGQVCQFLHYIHNATQIVPIGNLPT